VNDVVIIRTLAIAVIIALLGNVRLRVANGDIDGVEPEKNEYEVKDNNI